MDRPCCITHNSDAPVYDRLPIMAHSDPPVHNRLLMIAQGTPVMIGGGELAFTLLGVDFNDRTGEVRSRTFSHNLARDGSEATSMRQL